MWASWDNPDSHRLISKLRTALQPLVSALSLSSLCEPPEPRRRWNKAATDPAGIHRLGALGSTEQRCSRSLPSRSSADTGPSPTPPAGTRALREGLGRPWARGKILLGCGWVEASAGLRDGTQSGPTRSASPCRAAGGRHFRSAPMPPPINGGGRRVPFSRHPMKKDHSGWRRCRAAPGPMRARERRWWTNSPPTRMRPWAALLARRPMGLTARGASRLPVVPRGERRQERPRLHPGLGAVAGHPAAGNGRGPGSARAGGELRAARARTRREEEEKEGTGPHPAAGPPRPLCSPRGPESGCCPGVRVTGGARQEALCGRRRRAGPSHRRSPGATGGLFIVMEAFLFPFSLPLPLSSD